MNASAANRTSFSAFENALRQSLSPQERADFSSFYTSAYRASFSLPKIGQIRAHAQKIGQQFTFQVLEVYPTQDALLDIVAQKAMVGFSFYAEGKATGILVDQEVEIPMVPDTGIICVSNYGRSCLQFFKDQPFVNINLFIPSADFIDFLGEKITNIPEEFRTALYDDRVYYGIGGPTTAPVAQLLKDLRYDNFSGPGAAFSKECAALQIMATRLNNLIYAPEVPSPDQEKVQLARDIMEGALVDPPSVKSLARQVGLSEYKLKQGFKQNYQTSVYAFLIDCRMKKAIELLVHQGQSVKETAYAIGYSNPNAFSNAFRKKYGVYPTEFVKNKSLYPSG